ncbi:MAG: 3'(2'),5'-bisphosphate nucleotidase CysQ [Lunatimonas sp.]|uniref:3'(2'),5'-bisphosphate nucleotidase CysQ n=1 Tax=Lunatimonas sp. TaxID=2060141 RepID=UPI00263B529D|nr:3'(2'),5'-bisphosphate nucleotidase CysQ [Lunatimonas sp.]MCC5935818.1 3'(2'),5'-bisphosphate nucleotidase CysQ [Lunatimonas sp.]
MEIDLQALTEVAKRAAHAAGEKILEIYETADVEIAYKKDDSPLTKADQAAHHVIMEFLHETGIPVLSEEGKDIPYTERSQWDFFWMVDPLDGTKEFIRKNGEFTVNIALIHTGQPILGVVYAPVLDWLYWGNGADGAWKQVGEALPVKLNLPDRTHVQTIVASRSHLNEETQAFLDKFPSVDVISMGSSLKFLLVAEDKAQVYPRFAPTMEWDTAAAHGVLKALGAEVVLANGTEPLQYNKEQLLNPYFICFNTGTLPG